MKSIEITKPLPLREQVYEAILSQLRGGRYAPGERVTEERIAGDLGVSRTPVREAMGQLNRHGLLLSRKSGGYMVPSPTIKEMEEIICVRRLVEPHAVALAAQEYDDEHIKCIDKAIVQEVQSLNVVAPDAFAIGNLNFRSALFDQISNSYLISIVAQFYSHLEFIRIFTLNNLDVRKNVVIKQKSIRDAIAAHDASQAYKLWEGYLDFAQEALIAGMKEHQK